MSVPDRTTSEIVETQSLRSGVRAAWDWLVNTTDTLQVVPTRRRARFLSTLLLILTLGGVASLAVSAAFDLATPFQSNLMAIVGAVLAGTYFISQANHTSLAATIAVAVVAALPFAIFLGRSDQSDALAMNTFVWCIVALLMAGVLLQKRGILALLTVILLGLILLPIYAPGLTILGISAAMLINLLVGIIILLSHYQRDQVESERSSELLREMQESRSRNRALEQRVTGLTRNMALAADVSQTVSQLRDLNTLLIDAVELIRSRFALYYVQIYLADDVASYLTLRAGTGSEGKDLLAKGHRLLIGPGSINGLAAGNKSAVVVSDTRNSKLFYANSTLPLTRSEMAVPLIAGDRMVGVLDLQGARPNDLTDAGLPVFTAMAGQLATAIENARLFTENSNTRSELETRIATGVKNAWHDYLDGINRRDWVGYVHQDATTTPLADPLSEGEVNGNELSAEISLQGASLGSLRLERGPEHPWTDADREIVLTISAQVAQKVENLRLLAEAEQYRFEAEEAARRLIREGWQEHIGQAESKVAGYSYDHNQIAPVTGDISEENLPAISRPLIIQGEAIGYLDILESSEDDEFVAELVTAVAGRLSDHLENLRLSRQTEKALSVTEEQARRLAHLNQMGAAFSTAQDEAAIFGVIHQYVPNILDSEHTSIALLDPEGDSAEVFSLTASEGLVTAGQHLSIRGTAAGKTIHENRLIRVQGSQTAVYRDTSELEQSGLLSSMFAPLSAGGQAIGALCVSCSKANAYSESSENLMNQVTSLLSSTTQNHRLLEQIQSRAVARAALNDVSQIILAQADSDSIFRTAVQAIVSSFRLSFAGIWIREENSEILSLRYTAGMPLPSLEQHNKVRLNSHHVLATIATTRRPYVTNDLLNDPKSVWGDAHQLAAFAGYPLMVGSELLGALGMFSEIPLAEATIPLLQSLSVQVGTVANTQRLIEQTRKRAAELETVAQLSAAISTTLETGKLLQSVVDLTKSSFDLYHAHIYLLDQANAELKLAAGAGEIGQQMVIEQTSIPLHQEQSLAARAARTRQAVIVHNVYAEPGFLPHPLLPETRSEMAVPLIAGDQVLGVLDVQADTLNRFTKEDILIQTTLAAQVAVAMQNAQNFESTQRRARYEQTMREITARISGSADVETVMKTAVEEIGRAIGRRVFVQLGSNRPETASESKNGA